MNNVSEENKNFRNVPTVVVVLVMTTEGLLLIRRGLKDGYGKLALPGGYQEFGQTWQEAGVAEVLQETGLQIDPDKLNIINFETVQDGAINLLFAKYSELVSELNTSHDNEVIEVLFAKEAVETAFPTHTKIIKSFFENEV